jgi:hypothetical protein
MKLNFSSAFKIIKQRIFTRSIESLEIDGLNYHLKRLQDEKIKKDLALWLLQK